MAHQTILIIDDIPDHRAVLRRLLQAVGYDVIEAASGAEAMRHAQQRRPDLILASLSLPGHDAGEVPRQLRAQPALAKTPILGTTVYNTLLPSSHIRAMGCADCIEKPFDVDDLLCRISRLLPKAPHAAAYA